MAGVEATITESPTAVTEFPATRRRTGVGAPAKPGVGGEEDAACAEGPVLLGALSPRCGTLSLACREPPSEAACDPPRAAEADAKSSKLPAMQIATATARTQPRTAAARRRDGPSACAATAFLCFAIKNGRAEIQSKTQWSRLRLPGRTVL